MPAPGVVVNKNYRGLDPYALCKKFLLILENRIFLTLEDLALEKITGNEYGEGLLENAQLAPYGFCEFVTVKRNGQVVPMIRRQKEPFLIYLPNLVLDQDLYLIFENNTVDHRYIGARFECHDKESFVPIKGCAFTHLGKILQLNRNGTAILLPSHKVYDPVTGGWP